MTDKMKMGLVEQEDIDDINYKAFMDENTRLLPLHILYLASLIGVFIWGLLWAIHKATIWPFIICIVLVMVFVSIGLIISMFSKES